MESTVEPSPIVARLAEDFFKELIFVVHYTEHVVSLTAYSGNAQQYQNMYVIAWEGRFMVSEVLLARVAHKILWNR